MQPLSFFSSSLLLKSLSICLTPFSPVLRPIQSLIHSPLVPSSHTWCKTPPPSQKTEERMGEEKKKREDFHARTLSCRCAAFKDSSDLRRQEGRRVAD